MINSVGRRKASVARIYLTKGDGKVTINGKDYKEYFPQMHIQGSVVDPLIATEIVGIYDINVNVNFVAIKRYFHAQDRIFNKYIGQALSKILGSQSNHAIR